MSTPLRPVTERPKGVVAPTSASRKFRLARYQPPAGLAAFLDHAWLVEWDLRGQPAYTQRTLPYPCVNLVFDAGRTALFGVVRGAFDYTLAGRGRALGLRFRPGAFRAVLGRPVHTVTDRVLPLPAVFAGLDDEAAAGFERAVLEAGDDAAMVAAAADFLQPRLPPPDARVESLQAILAQAAGDGLLTRVEALAERAGMSVRALQQCFADYLGVSPKWVVRRYRLHEAADRLAGGEAVDLAQLAQSLGYYDQAHFTRDFQRLVGQPPHAYRRQEAGA
ncbi:AraC family transcriptional regulator [Cupriavidus sp. USMAHM13]|uniref:AraC family transcriptional regulator n=1 Tax=Cupriavidus malaysiensis TaxID=367825 RepID=A0A1D9I692_9BURK|nr:MULTISPECIES: helix-turn-helix domain-containing protein [Cupriavidus]AOZ00818.1 AraC family transcriptional regulator [Cupriavidus sp. USMAHM13]AOZ07578.1 AraC family transcriptional regulator [Cupriavidus malaysiensis]